MGDAEQEADPQAIGLYSFLNRLGIDDLPRSIVRTAFAAAFSSMSVEDVVKCLALVAEYHKGTVTFAGFCGYLEDILGDYGCKNVVLVAEHMLSGHPEPESVAVVG